MAKTFSKRIQEAMAKQSPRNLTGGTWRGIKYPHIYLDKKNNFIDGGYPIKCDVKGNLSGDRKKIKYHNGAAHMNSSQIMCINFFKKFFEEEEWESLLVEVLKNVGVPIASDGIKAAAFEYEPDHNEGTNFDFYLVMNDNTHISMEIKFTESEFGSISKDKNDPDKYSRKWTLIYKRMVEKSSYLDCNMHDFYENYQVNRNIVYARNSDIVLFLTPKANKSKRIVSGRKHIDSFTSRYSNIRNIYWEDLVNALFDKLSDSNLEDYYKKFRNKYIDILTMEED